MIVYTRYLRGCGLVVWLSVFLCLKWWEVCFFEEKWSDDQALIKLFFPLWVTIQIVASLWKCWKIYEKCRDDKNSCLCYRSVTGYAPLAGTVSFFLCKSLHHFITISFITLKMIHFNHLSWYWKCLKFFVQNRSKLAINHLREHSRCWLLTLNETWITSVLLTTTNIKYSNLFFVMQFSVITRYQGNVLFFLLR